MPCTVALAAPDCSENYIDRVGLTGNALPCCIGCILVTNLSTLKQAFEALSGAKLRQSLCLLNPCCVAVESNVSGNRNFEDQTVQVAPNMPFEILPVSGRAGMLGLRI